MKAHLVRGWRMSGAEVTVEHYGTTMGRGWDAAGEREHRERNARWRETASALAAGGGLDLVFLVAFDDVLESATLRHFRSLGAKLVLYHTDMLTQWYKVLRISRLVDLMCCGSLDHARFFERRGVPLLHIGFAALPPAAEELAAPVQRYDGVLYAGSPWPYRQRVLDEIARAGLPLRIHGHSWQRTGGWPRTPGRWRKMAHDLRRYLAPRLQEEGLALAAELGRRLVRRGGPAIRHALPAGVVAGAYRAEQFVPLVRGAAVNLGFTQMPLDPDREYPRMLRLREFEIPMTGAFYLTQSCPELGLYYDVGREIAVWDTARDVVERCRYYLAHPQERADIAQAGRRRALANHTWLHRFAALAARVGMRLPREPANAAA